VGFHFNKRQLEDFGDLAGVSADSEVSSKGPIFRENTLFTHTGLSGPAILQASLYWKPNQELLLNLCPETDVKDWLIQRKKAGAKAEVKNISAELLPKRLAERFGELFGKAGRLAELSDSAIAEFARHINSWTIVPKDNFGYAKAEVTRGGVDTKELSSKNMESKKVPGLYFIGEVVDVTGQLGGFNFQWAWVSAWAAGETA
jgi:predicted Rossmann fold flavoprotein